MRWRERTASLAPKPLDTLLPASTYLHDDTGVVGLARKLSGSAVWFSGKTLLTLRAPAGANGCECCIDGRGCTPFTRCAGLVSTGAVSTGAMSAGAVSVGAVPKGASPKDAVPKGAVPKGADSLAGAVSPKQQTDQQRL